MFVTICPNTLAMILMAKPGAATYALARFIEEAIFSQGLTHEQAAERLRTSQVTVSRWVRGASLPGREAIKRLPQGLGVDPERLVELYLRAKAEQQESLLVEEEVQAVERVLQGLPERERSTHESLERRIAELELKFDQFLARFPPHPESTSPPRD